MPLVKAVFDKDQVEPTIREGRGLNEPIAVHEVFSGKLGGTLSIQVEIGLQVALLVLEGGRSWS